MAVSEIAKNSTYLLISLDKKLKFENRHGGAICISPIHLSILLFMKLLV